MRKAISDRGIGRIAKVIRGQEEPDYGKGDPGQVKQAMEVYKAQWTPEGWVVPKDLWIFNSRMTKLPLIKSVNGDFKCDNNRLTSLAGSPLEVSGDFDCSFNKIKTLEGGPEHVGGNYSCSGNQLTTLEGTPRRIEGNLSCNSNPLVTLEGSPEYIGGYFWCYQTQLTSLEGLGEVVGEISTDVTEGVSTEKVEEERGPISVEDVARKLLEYETDWLYELGGMDDTSHWVEQIAADVGVSQDDYEDDLLEAVYDAKDDIKRGNDLSPYDESIITIARRLLDREIDFVSESYTGDTADWVREAAEEVGVVENGDDLSEDYIDQVYDEMYKIIGV